MLGRGMCCSSWEALLGCALCLVGYIVCLPAISYNQIKRDEHITTFVNALLPHNPKHSSPRRDEAVASAFFFGLAWLGYAVLLWPLVRRCCVGGGWQAGSTRNSLHIHSCRCSSYTRSASRKSGKYRRLECFSGSARPRPRPCIFLIPTNTFPAHLIHIDGTTNITSYPGNARQIPRPQGPQIHPGRPVDFIIRSFDILLTV
ncbi:hypothetical protein BJ138DRAFT_757761 [Hygrophoropsis aurantiaca]|uniref:Uncharacterized protein n=1 Tax=Hygrophoropsis aurantiaca TaxID=72124 RepID=A0ACB7ZXR1_9AGAM|nr:hypothetical protein BJ138DRAFT_757761 [Hygrophoropsis aurantiaca]